VPDSLLFDSKISGHQTAREICAKKTCRQHCLRTGWRPVIPLRVATLKSEAKRPITASYDIGIANETEYPVFAANNHLVGPAVSSLMQGLP
jgi:hypothetical protein